MEDLMPDFGNCHELLSKNREKFEAFSTMLLDCNAQFNLTAITKREEIEVKHFLDSLAAERLFPHGASVVEVGSGAGFPSIPLMLAREDLRFVLIESTRKKCEFLKAAARELSLSAEVVCMRAEDAGKDAAFRERFDVCCARAVAPMPALAEYCLPLVKCGGLFVAYKGESAEEGESAISTLGGKCEKVISYELPEEMGRRKLYLIKKVRPTPKKYPRGNGAERKDPIL